jgi:hypothetical protein
MAPSKQQEIVVPPIEKGKFKVTIIGDSPLISHRFSDSQKKAMLDKQMKKAQAAKEAKNPEKDYAESIYKTRDGKPGFPASGIKGACVAACSFIEGMTKVEARGAFYILGDILPIKGEPRMREDIVRLGGKVADLRYRAEFPEWSIDLDVLHNPRVISAEAIVNLIENAGFSVGLGDWRPQKNGSFGMFRVKRG